MIKIVDNIILLGTSHVAKESEKEILDVIERYSPEVVGIELDASRLHALMNKSAEKTGKRYTLKMMKEVGVSGFAFAMIAGFMQKKIGKSLGIEPGIDMKSAYMISRDKKIPTALIDLNLKLTLRKLSALKFTQKVSMFANLFFKSFKKEYRKKLHFDVKKGVPDEKVIAEMINVIRKEVPLLYKILIHDRNIHMSNRLLKLRENHPEGYLLAVVGAGHVAGMQEYLEETLKEQNRFSQNSISYSFTIETE